MEETEEREVSRRLVHKKNDLSSDTELELMSRMKISSLLQAMKEEDAIWRLIKMHRCWRCQMSQDVL
jgi:hypothetical protein